MDQILHRINSPSDLKNLTEAEIQTLAEEIRTLLVQTISKNGGHLAPNLGVVELTLALHLVFDSPNDKIVWDVGHQSYVHKIVTGRYQQFDTLRQYGGLSGFTKPGESEHDAFIAGHSSTSISVALGLAKARDLKHEKHKVIAVIGDGSMTGGMAFEGLNHLGQLQTDMIVVLNDNEMSISKNVGALSRYLTKMKLNPRIRKIRTDLEDLLKKVPRIGSRTVEYIKRIEDSLNYLVIPGMFFEDLGLKYIGPIDGHNLEELKTALNHAKLYEKPVLLHVLTTKGKGYIPAEKNPQRFHGTGPFDVITGNKLTVDVYPTYTDIFGKVIVDLARCDKRILAITAAMADGSGLLPFAKEFPGRFIDTAIAEQHAVTMAAALAKSGFRPIFAVYSTFLQRAYDQILHDVCLQNLPVIFAIDRAGLVANDGPTHHGIFDFTYLRHIPNIVIMAPKDENELKDMLYTATQMQCPVAIRYPKRAGMHTELSDGYIELPLGKAEILQKGEKVALVAIGSMVKVALEAAELLEQAGMECTVINARYVKPLDEDLLLETADKYEVVITLEENVVTGGFGSAVAELYTIKQKTNCRLLTLGLPDEFIPQGSNDILFKQYGLDAAGIFRTVKSLNVRFAKKAEVF